MGGWNRRFHLEKPLPDGNVWRGSINIDADTEDDLYQLEDIKGEFWVEKTTEGWRGRFTLECGVPDKRTGSPFVGTGLEYYVYTAGIYKPNGDEVVGRESVPRIEGRLEDYIKAMTTTKPNDGK